MSKALNVRPMTDAEQEALLAHVGHAIEVATYGSEEQLWDAAIECVRCHQVLFDIDLAAGGSEVAAAALAAHAGHRVKVGNGVMTGVSLVCRRDEVVLRSEKSLIDS